jgi:serine/threonine protein kinase
MTGADCRWCGRHTPLYGPYCAHCGKPAREFPQPWASDFAYATGADFVGMVVDGRYETVELIGRGGMADVYRAAHRTTGAIVALKVGHPGDMVSRIPERFHLEALNAGRVRHEGVARVHDEVTTLDGRPCLVMDFADGETLDRLIERDGALPPERVVEIARQAADALGAVHRLGIIHRDLKPGSFVVEARNGREVVKLIDFSIATALEGPGRDLITPAGSVVGVPHYMSPEAWRGVGEDQRRDVYALGVTMYEMLTGRKPFDTESFADLAMAHLSEAVPTLPPSVPARLRDIVMRCLAKEPADRYADATEVAGALAAAPEGDRESSKGPVPRPERHGAFDVFISHSSKNHAEAFAAAHTLEARGIRCWVAPRDVPPGSDWDEAIMDGIAACRIMLLMHSAHSNESRHVKQEVLQALEHHLTIVPIRLQDIPFSKGLRFHLGAAHWLDALTPPFESHLQVIADRVEAVLRALAPRP